MRCSIVVVTHNHKRHIAACLASLLPTLGSNDEVIVVDNASVDGTPQLIAGDFPSVRLLSNAGNRGFGAACNQAAHISQADILVFLNPDTEPRHGWLDPLLAGTVEGLTTPKILLRDRPACVDTFGHEVHISGLAVCHGWGQPAAAYRKNEYVAAVSGACFAISRAVFTHLGGFDERLFLYYEDDDLSLRARLAGFACVAVADAEVMHDHRPGFSAEKLRYLERNRLWVTLKIYGWTTLLQLTPALLGAEAMGWGLALISGPRHVVAKAQAWYDLVRWLPSLPTERRGVERRLADRALLRLHHPTVSFAQVSDGAWVSRAERWAGAVFARVSPR